MLWKEKYELGVPLIDEQHKELFKRVESFMQVLRMASSWEDKVEKVNETLNFMNTYVVEHFRDEEAFQQEIGYPGEEEHKKVHADMVNYVIAVTEEYKNSGYDEQLIQKFAGKLMAWLINHVASEDQRIAAYAISKGVDRND